MKKHGFINTIEHLKEGMLVEELDKAIREAVAATKLTGKQSTVTLKINVGLIMKDDPSMMKLKEDVDLKLPKMDRLETSFHVTDENDLSRHHPGQLDITNVLEEDEVVTRVIE